MKINAQEKIYHIKFYNALTSLTKHFHIYYYIDIEIR